MRIRFPSLMLVAVLAIVLVQSTPDSLVAQAQSKTALTGQVTSAEEGPMEGVLVSAKKTGSPITITVVSERDGRYRFPQARLEQGLYALRIRATGYDLEGAANAHVVAGKSATANLRLV